MGGLVGDTCSLSYGRNINKQICKCSYYFLQHERYFILYIIPLLKFFDMM